MILAGDILPFALPDKPNEFIDFVADNYEKVFEYLAIMNIIILT